MKQIYYVLKSKEDWVYGSRKIFKIRPDILVKETTLFQTMAHIKCSETSHGGFLQTNIKILKKYV